MAQVLHSKPQTREGATLPVDILLKPPFRREDVATDIDYDPAEAEKLIAVVRNMRREGAEPAASE